MKKTKRRGPGRPRKLAEAYFAITLRMDPVIAAEIGKWALKVRSPKISMNDALVELVQDAWTRHPDRKAAAALVRSSPRTKRRARSVR